MRRVKGISLALAAVLAGSINLAEAKSGDNHNNAGEKTESATGASKTGGRTAEIDSLRLLKQQGTTTTTAPTTTTTAPPPPPPPADAAALQTPVLAPEPPPPPPLAVPWAPIVCPVQGPMYFIDSWGFPRSGGRSHQGTDMMSEYGVWTVAPVDGVVEHRSNGLGGLTWYLYGDDGNTYYGAHLQAYENVGVGWVAAGTVIGYVGDSGNAQGTPPHLHFEFHPGGGGPVNPYELLTSVCPGAQ
jgi:murein DD-endopeptidase MepM/ murein hydrolase activator NlpD